MNRLQETLLNWYAQNRRNLPWRNNPSPYQVWISEVILQQTRVSQGLEYYLRFIEKWPDVKALAQASEDEVLKMWQGLGYYSRARNLHLCAKQVVTQFCGDFPADYEQLKQLKGVGDYTAAAIASIAFNLPCAVVDGNVYRFLSRLFDINTPINDKKGQKLFAQLADELLDRRHPSLHNQAMMEFGALQCTPKNPNCLLCPLQAQCLAFGRQTVMQRPVKSAKTKVTTQYLIYLVFRLDDKICLRKRSDKGIWRNLYDFPCLECKNPMSVEDAIASEEFKQLIGNVSFTVSKASPIFTHKLTHRTLIAQFIEIKLLQEWPPIETKDIFLARERDLENYPIPRLIDLYLNT
ncbi:MAG: A/G-specific adenine glycosylase [Bacteroidales bacterium]|nr:A/G-specific adenine glycosylase [Bacteroidales bacterium]